MHEHRVVALVPVLHLCGVEYRVDSAERPPQDQLGAVEVDECVRSRVGAFVATGPQTDALRVQADLGSDVAGGLKRLAEVVPEVVPEVMHG